ncbi:MAG: RodZ domain-containing protein [Candidatus Methylomirabilaceae bacterium]
MESGAGSPQATIGELLKEARTAKGLTIEAAASASKISPYMVRLMEEQQFHLVPDPIYIIRFLLEYSGFLGLDPKQVERQFRRQIHLPGSSAPLQPAVSLRPRIGIRRPILYLLSAVAAIPLIFVIVSLFAGRPPELPPAREPQPPASHETSSQPPPAPSVAPTARREITAEAERPSAAKATASTTAPTVPAAQDKPPRHMLRAEARRATWIAVSIDGSTKREVALQLGGAAQWSAKHGFVVSIGDAEAIALYLNGNRVTLPGGRGRVIQNLPLAGDREPVTTR